MNNATVNAVYTQQANTKNGQITLYSVYLKGVDGKIGSGFDGKIRAACATLNKGDTVEYEAQQNNKGYMEFTSLTKKTDGQAASVAQGGGEDRQESIMRQSAMGYAAQVVAAQMTSKSSLEQAASDVVDLADRFFVPYAKHGLDVAQEEEENSRTQDAQDTSTEDDEGEPF